MDLSNYNRSLQSNKTLNLLDWKMLKIYRIDHFLGEKKRGVGEGKRAYLYQNTDFKDYFLRNFSNIYPIQSEVIRDGSNRI